MRNVSYIRANFISPLRGATLSGINSAKTVRPCRITRACTSIRSVYLFNDHVRPGGEE